MSTNRRILALVAVTAALVFAFVVFTPDEGRAAPAMVFSSSAQCAECHPTQYEEWQDSQHSVSWTNPRVRFLSNDFANQDCIDCHAPRPVFVTGVAKRVLPRTSRRTEGVDCITCHMLPENPDGTPGGVAGSLNDPRAACRPTARLELTRPDFCAGCHNQHKTVDQWRESEWAQQGEDCLSCHMPYRDGDPNKGRDHRFPGGDELFMLQRAVDLRGRYEDGVFVVEVENVGAGHSYPTDERSRASDVFWRPLAADGAEPGPWRHLYRIRDPYRTEVDITPTLLHAGETWTGPLPPEAGDGPVEVALFYMRSPYFSDPDAPDPDAEAIRVHRIELAP